MLHEKLGEFKVLEDSAAEQDGTVFVLVQAGDTGKKALAVTGNTSGFSGETHADSGALICLLSSANAAALRQRLSWLRAVPLGLKTSVGFGDRLGVATTGHVASVRGSTAAPIFAQQSVRENTRTGRTPQQVMDDATWGVFQTGWREAWGADADHMKLVTDIDPFVDAGYTFFTIDPGDHVDDAAETADDDTLREKVDALPWDALQSSPDSLRSQIPQTITLDGLTLDFDEHTIFKAGAKYGRAVAHTAKMARHLRERKGGAPFDLEMSVDETNTTTTLQEHFYITSELKRLGVSFESLAPRFVGRFEKGVDYIGDLDELDRNIAGHAAVMRHFGNSYKLSVHTGSDKFGVYPLALKHTGGLVHVKTAGTSYLEALRVMALVKPALFREVLDFARERYERDRVTYHVSAQLNKVPAASDLSDAQLPDLLNQFDARQVLHVTFGSVLDTYGDQLRAMLKDHEAEYHATIKTHFDRHLAAFRK
jgi:tagaturonate epimerase